MIIYSVKLYDDKLNKCVRYQLNCFSFFISKTNWIVGWKMAWKYLNKLWFRRSELDVMMFLFLFLFPSFSLILSRFGFHIRNSKNWNFISILLILPGDNCGALFSPSFFSSLILPGFFFFFVLFSSSFLLVRCSVAYGDLLPSPTFCPHSLFPPPQAPPLLVLPTPPAVPQQLRILGPSEKTRPRNSWASAAPLAVIEKRDWTSFELAHNLLFNCRWKVCRTFYFLTNITIQFWNHSWVEVVLGHQPSEKWRFQLSKSIKLSLIWKRLPLLIKSSCWGTNLFSRATFDLRQRWKRTLRFFSTL